MSNPGDPFAPGQGPGEPQDPYAQPPAYGAPGYGPPGYAPPPYGPPPGYGPNPYGPPPGYGPNPYGPPPGHGIPYGYQVQSTAGTNGMAIASLVLGIVWVYWIGSILALIFGYIARSQLSQRPQNGGGLAVAGIVLGWVGVGTLLLVIGVAVGSPNR